MDESLLCNGKRKLDNSGGCAPPKKRKLKATDSIVDEGSPRVVEEGPDDAPPRKLKCPYYQRKPPAHQRKSCKSISYKSMRGVKFHLERVHTRPPECGCCRTGDSCAKTESKLQSLNLNRGPFARVDPETKWTLLFREIFGNEETVPCPYEELGMSIEEEKLFLSLLTDSLVKRFGLEIPNIRSEIHKIIKECKRRSQGPENQESFSEDAVFVPLLKLHPEATRPDRQVALGRSHGDIDAFRGCLNEQLAIRSPRIELPTTLQEGTHTSYEAVPVSSRDSNWGSIIVDSTETDHIISSQANVQSPDNLPEWPSIGRGMSTMVDTTTAQSNQSVDPAEICDYNHEVERFFAQGDAFMWIPDIVQPSFAPTFSFQSTSNTEDIALSEQQQTDGPSGPVAKLLGLRAVHGWET